MSALFIGMFINDLGNYIWEKHLFLSQKQFLFHVNLQKLLFIQHFQSILTLTKHQLLVLIQFINIVCIHSTVRTSLLLNLLFAVIIPHLNLQCKNYMHT